MAQYRARIDLICEVVPKRSRRIDHGGHDQANAPPMLITTMDRQITYTMTNRA